MNKYAQTLEEIDRLLSEARGPVREFLYELRKAFLGLDKGWGDVAEILAIANSWGESITHREAMNYLRAINQRGSMWHAEEAFDQDVAQPVRYVPGPRDLIRIFKAERCMCALIGSGMAEGEAEFVPIAEPGGLIERQTAGLQALHALLTRVGPGRWPVLWV